MKKIILTKEQIDRLDLENLNIDNKKEEIDELIDSDLNIIGGDDTYNTTNQIKTSKAQTTDKFIKTSRYESPYRLNGGLSYTNGYVGIRETELEDEQITEDINTAEEKGKEQAEKITRKDIPDISELANTYHKQNVFYNTRNLIKMINQQTPTQEEKAIIINYIITQLNTSDIDNELKNILKSKI